MSQIPCKVHTGIRILQKVSNTTQNPWKVAQLRIPGKSHKSESLESRISPKPWKVAYVRNPGKSHKSETLESVVTQV